MNEFSSKLYFELTGLWVGVAVTCVILLGLSLWSYRTARARVNPSRRMLLQGLRVGAVAMVLFLLADPHRVVRETFREPREIAVLVDRSVSMSLEDTPVNATRWSEAVRFANELAEAGDFEADCRYYTFGEELEAVESLAAIGPESMESRFSRSVDQLLTRGRDVPLGAVVLLSDGQFSDPDACLKTAMKLRRAGIPLYAVELGNEEEEPDVVIRGALGRQIIPFDPKVRLDVKLGSPGYADRAATLAVRREGRLLYERRIQLNGGEQEIAVEFDSPFEGFHDYDLTVSELEGERLVENNQYAFGTEVRDEKIRVIYMEGTPHATQILESALEDDPDIEVASMYFPQGMALEAAKKGPYRTDREGRRVYNVGNIYRGYPTNMDALLKYDVVINSDIRRGAFSPEQLDNTVSLVEQHGGGFVMVGGSTAFGAGAYDKTVIDKLMPVDVYGATDSEWGSFKLELPEEAFAHPIMKVGATPEETRSAWLKSFPGFGGLNVVNRLKPGAVSLALHAGKQNQYGPLVVFAVQQIGRGRTMAFTSDTTQGWGASFERRFGTASDPIAYYRQFWNNAVRWLAADRIQRKAGELRVAAPSSRVRVGERVEFGLELADTVIDGELSLTVVMPDGTEQNVELEAEGVDGAKSAGFEATQEGRHRIVTRVKTSDDRVLFSRAMVEVVPNRRELETTRSNPTFLRTLAAKTNGRFSSGGADEFDLSDLRDLSAEFIEYRESTAWDRWWYLLVLAGLLGSEWFLRRRWGLA